MRGKIIDREIQTFVSHSSVTSADLGEQGVKKIYRKNDLTGEGVRLFYKGSSRSLSGSNEQTRFHAQITDKANT